MAAFKRRDRDNHWYYRRWVTLPDGTKQKISGKAPLNTKQSALDAERAHVDRLLNPPPAPAVVVPTVKEYLATWTERRKLVVATAGDDETRLRLHVLPHIGGMRLNEVKPRHVRDVVMALRALVDDEGSPALAPRTILKIAASLHSMFKSAFVEELIESNPVVFEPGVLPKKADKDPEWRNQAVYTRDEIEALLSDERIPADRRMLYALKMLTALRHTEAASLRWRQLDTTSKPLGRINLGKTKSGVPRSVPVHPTLAKMLATWRLSGWFNTYGRQPTADDLIVPALTMNARAPKEAQDALVGDLKLLGFRVEAGKHMNRRGHDMRRTFVSLAIADGARTDVIEWGTHGPRGDIMSMYTSLPWATICDEWAKLKIELREGALVSLQHAKRTALTERARKRWLKAAGAPDWTPGGHQEKSAGANQLQLAAVPPEVMVTPKGLEPLFSA